VHAPFDDGLLARALASEGSGFGDWKTCARSTIDTTSMGRWRKLPKVLVQELAPIVNPTLERCGYEPVRQRAPLSQDAARERYELGLKVQGLKATPPAADDADSRPAS